MITIGDLERLTLFMNTGELRDTFEELIRIARRREEEENLEFEATYLEYLKDKAENR